VRRLVRVISWPVTALVEETLYLVIAAALLAPVVALFVFMPEGHPVLLGAGLLAIPVVVIGVFRVMRRRAHRGRRAGTAGDRP
jgi:hypothetical protein